MAITAFAYNLIRETITTGITHIEFQDSTGTPVGNRIAVSDTTKVTMLDDSDPKTIQYQVVVSGADMGVGKTISKFGMFDADVDGNSYNDGTLQDANGNDIDVTFGNSADTVTLTITVSTPL